MHQSDPQSILITGGTGLVGKAIQGQLDEQLLKDFKWIFLSSKDCDLRYLSYSLVLGTLIKLENCSQKLGQLMSSIWLPWWEVYLRIWQGMLNFWSIT